MLKGQLLTSIGLSQISPNDHRSCHDGACCIGWRRSQSTWVTRQTEALGILSIFVPWKAFEGARYTKDNYIQI